MAATAPNPKAESARALNYEQPLSERMRTFLRLEFLYQQLLYNCDVDSDWATRAIISSLLEIMAILTRGDVRSEVHKELDLNIDNLKRFQSQPGVDGGRLGNLIANLAAAREDIDAIGTQFMQPLKDSEFLSAIKHRSSIPGGTCEFDLPEYSHWLRQPFERRQKDIDVWIAVIRPICDAVTELLWLIRESAQPVEKTAINGMYQHRMQKDRSCRLLRVTLPENTTLYPEISGSQHLFTIRFLDWSTIDKRAVQTGHDVEFKLSIC
jgi:cell division protein ZapD